MQPSQAELHMCNGRYEQAIPIHRDVPSQTEICIKEYMDKCSYTIIIIAKNKHYK